MTGVPVVFTIKRPFSGASVYTGVSGTLTADMPCGRGTGLSGQSAWTHYLDVAASVDVRDGQTRPAGSDGESYADGDAVVITGGTSGIRTSTYVVVWVEYSGSGDKRAYLLRDTW